jgi:hypothetical protein
MVAGGAAAFLHRLEIRQHHPAEFRQVRVPPLPVEKRAAKLVLELLDRARQRRLADVALLGRAGKVERPRKRDEISDVLHLHRQRPKQPRAEPAITRSQRVQPAGDDSHRASIRCPLGL